MNSKLKVQLSILQFFQYYIWGSWYVTAGTYLINELGFSGTQVGWVYGATAISAFISPFLSGLLADRFFSVERLLGSFHFLGGILLFFMSETTTFFWFYSLLLIYTFLFVPTFALSTSVVFHHIVDRSKDFPQIRVWGTIGWIVAGLVVGMLHWEATALPMKMSAIGSIIMAIYCFILPQTPPPQSKQSSLGAILGQEGRALFAKRAFIIFVIGITLIRIPSSFYYSFVNPFLHELGMQNTAGKMTLGQLSELIIMLSMPFLLRHIRLKAILVIGMLTWGIRYLLFSYGNMEGNLWMLYGGIILHGVAFNFTALVSQIYVDQIVPPHLRSTAQGFIAFLTLGCGALAGAYIAGWVVEAYAFTNGLHAWSSIWKYPASIAAVVALFFILLFWPNKKEKHVPT
ncbi:MAG: MFS transporter [Bacteroidota bacterium]